MSNHIHLITEAIDHNLSDILRDFKSYTTKLLIKAIVEMRKAGGSGCFHSLKKQPRKIAIIQVYNSGNKIISTNKSAARILLFGSLGIFISNW